MQRQFRDRSITVGENTYTQEQLSEATALAEIQERGKCIAFIRAAAGLTGDDNTCYALAHAIEKGEHRHG